MARELHDSLGQVLDMPVYRWMPPRSSPAQARRTPRQSNWSVLAR
jgi:hypothetical protein